MAETVAIRPVQEKDKAWIAQVLSEHFGSTKIVSRGKLHEALTLPGQVAVKDSEQIGLLHYDIADEDCEIVVIISLLPKHDIGRKLLDSAKTIAKTEKCTRLWLITTNDNKSAQTFYRHLGGVQVAMHKNAVKEARKLKPEIPQFGENGIPIRDEIEFEWKLGDNP